MKNVREALIEIARALDELAIPYAVIGGVAVGVWAQPRLTDDVDITLWLGDRDRNAVLGDLLRRFKPAAPDYRATLERDDILMLRTSASTRIDLFFARFPMQKMTVERSKTMQIEGYPVHVCTLEDLIVHKIISDRPKDLIDADDLVHRNWRELDSIYLEGQIQELSRDYDDESVLQRWRELKRSAEETWKGKVEE